jgi:DNA mismatch repair protein MutS
MAAIKKAKETPLMQQYNRIKSKYPEALLLFRVGDFYETFGQDAITAANILGIVLTARNNGGSKIELAGFPHHSLQTYLPKLVRGGVRVAVCDQLEEATKGKKIVKRGVTELVTPGVVLNDQILENKGNNFLAALHFNKEMAGIALLDISTGEFYVAQGNLDYISKLVNNFRPNEILYQRNMDKVFQEKFKTKAYSFRLDEWVFKTDFATEKLNHQFGTKSLKGFGIDKMDLAVIASGAVLHYITSAEHHNTSHISSIQRVEKDTHVWMDDFTVNNLELIHSPHANGRTLADILDYTATSMGGRMLKNWILFPLKSQKAIHSRLEMVNHLYNDSSGLQNLSDQLKQVGDLERMASRLAVQKTSPRELNQLKLSLKAIHPIKEFCSSTNHAELNKISKLIRDNDNIIHQIDQIIRDDAPVIIGKGAVVKEGFSKDLDELRSISSDGKAVLLSIQKREIEATGISSLKIAYNNVFGYYIEVRNTHKDKVPEDWVRKQTLTAAERYITAELKEYEDKILGAEEKILKLEQNIFSQLVLDLVNEVKWIVHNAKLVARLDCLHSFAKVSKANDYNMPVVKNGQELAITNGRHPVIERHLPLGEEYIPNDVYLDSDKQQIMMITGPNMSGKSALLRQTALIVIMAQIGCFVPAEVAEIGVVDKIFTRVGASDNISSGESTFMVEMNETSSIMNNLSSNCLILLDEIGRGTSTYDGISIAWAIAEYLHENKKFHPKTMFATHYHELNNMADKFSRIKNFNVSVKEMDKKILFLRKLKAGGSAHSFGIHVAKVAGMPKKIVNRAENLLKDLENNSGQKNSVSKNSKTKENEEMQLSFFQLDDPVLSEIKDQIEDLDINSLTPVDALLKLNEIKKMVGG